MADLSATIEATVRSCIHSYQDGAASKNPSLISRSLAPSCIRTIAPKSFLSTNGLPADMTLTNEQYQELFERDLITMVVSSSDFLNLVVDAPKRKCAAHTKHLLKFCDGEDMEMEFSWFFDLSEDGSKITRITEFIDTKEVLVMEGKNEKLRAEVESKTK